MARRVFFSFHYERDIWRANVVRNSWVTHEDHEAAGFWDASIWEEAKRKGDEAIKRLINSGLKGTTVTAVLVGAQTNDRKYVRYEIEKSVERENGLLAVHIHGIKNMDGETDSKGKNPFDYMYVMKDGKKVYLSELYRTYDWLENSGYFNFGDWVEKAAADAGK